MAIQLGIEKINKSLIDQIDYTPHKIEKGDL